MKKYVSHSGVVKRYGRPAPASKGDCGRPCLCTVPSGFAKEFHRETGTTPVGGGKTSSKQLLDLLDINGHELLHAVPWDIT